MADIYSLPEIDNFEENHYNWIHQYIQLQCNTSDIDLMSPATTLTAKGETNASLLIHEYIHFLQNFATNWGSAICVDLALAYLMIGASSAVSSEVYKPPLERAKITNTELLAGLDKLDSVRQKLIRSDKRTQIAGGKQHPITLSMSYDIVTFSNGLVEVQVGTKVIRESMAQMGTALYLGRKDSDVHENNQLISRKVAGAHPFFVAEEYWIVFEYFFEMACYPDVSWGVFALMQYALCTSEPERTVHRFFTYLRDAGPGPT